MKITFNLLGKHGQLGNQMFQYALLLGLKKKIHASIVFTQEIIEQSYLFKIFNLTQFEVDPQVPIETYIDTEFIYKEVSTAIKQDTNFTGYFQSEKYFEECEELVRHEFKFNSEVENRVNNYLAPYTGKHLISLHVRRGDYLINPDCHPLPTVEDYYLPAIEKLKKDNTVIVCVSDDIEWCKKNIPVKNIIFSGNDFIFDLCLITKCNDHIIANSSFSWWGSWLSEKKDRIIIAPPQWFGSRYKHWDTRDLYSKYFTVL